MDIKQLHYFSAIVNNDFNLSQTSKEVYVSQPTLSVLVNEFEKKEKVKLFKRRKGRLIGLTDKGNQFYMDALEVIDTYDRMRKHLHTENDEMKGKIKIGIPQVINTLVFSKVLPEVILNNKNISFEILEEGAYTLSSKLLSKEIDIAVLLHPEPISNEFIDTYTVSESELSIAVSPNHKLAKKNIIDWQDIHLENMVLFNQDFMINRLFNTNAAFHQINPNTVFESSSWDYLIEAVINNENLFTLLPHTISDIIKEKDVKLIKMTSPVPWVVTICRLKKSNYSKIENYVLEYFLNYFRNNTSYSD